MYITTTYTIAKTSQMNRKRSRPMQSSLAKSLPILVLSLLLVLPSQVTAFNTDSSTISTDFQDASIEILDGKRLECRATDEDDERARREVDFWEQENEDEDEFDELDGDGHEDEQEDEMEEEEDEEDEEEEEDLEYDDLERLYEEGYDTQTASSLMTSTTHDQGDDFDEEEDEEDYEDDHEEDFEEEEDEEYFEDNEEEDFDEEEYDYEEKEDFDEDEYDHEEDDVEEYYDESDWTPEEYKEMDILYSRYLQEIARRYGADWREEYELVVDKEEIYERYLEFEERKEEERTEAEQKEAERKEAEQEQRLEREAEERRMITQASHNALLQHEETRYHSHKNRTAEQVATESTIAGKAMVTNLLPRRDMVVMNTGISYYNYNKKNENSQESDQECPASRNTIATRHENCQNIVGSQ